MNRKRIARMVAVISILLILGAGLVSSGICVELTETTQQSFFETQEEKTLTKKDTGILLLSAILTKEQEVRTFLFRIIHQLKQKEELPESEVQILAEESFSQSKKIFLFEEIVANGPGIVFSFPGTLAAFFNKEIASLIIFQRGNLEVRTKSYEMDRFQIIGFYGNVENSRNRRFPDMWRFSIEGNCIIIIVNPES